MPNLFFREFHTVGVEAAAILLDIWVLGGEMSIRPKFLIRFVSEISEHLGLLGTVPILGHIYSNTEQVPIYTPE